MDGLAVAFSRIVATEGCVGPGAGASERTGVKCPVPGTGVGARGEARGGRVGVWVVGWAWVRLPFG
jgi:hypothetical protein